MLHDQICSVAIGEAGIREDDTGDNEFPHPDVRWVPHAAPFFGLSPIRSAYFPGPSIGSTLEAQRRGP
jgi:hypothetical protein